MGTMASNFELAAAADRFPYADDNQRSAGTPAALPRDYYTLLWEDEQGRYPIGYMLERVAQELLRVPASVLGGYVDVDQVNRTVLILQLPTEGERSRVMAALAAYWRSEDTFKLLRGWRNELCPVYGRKGELIFNVERATLDLLGAMRYGVHLTAFVRDAAAPHGLRIWVPTRAATKTFPGMLDNSVAGGLVTGEDHFEGIIREADEEASLPEELVRRRAQCAGHVTFIYITEEEFVGDSGFVYPECQWVYDLELPSDVVLQPKDGEVANFRLCDVDEVKRDLAAGKYKRGCAVVMLDFFIRWGILNKENEPDLAALLQRIHRSLPFPGPHQCRPEECI